MRMRVRVARIMRSCVRKLRWLRDAYRHDAMERVVVQLHVNPEPGSVVKKVWRFDTTSI